LIRRLRGNRIPALRGANKTSIAFALRNRPGTLFHALEGFAREGISLSRIESRPVPGKPWEYVFYVDALCGRERSARRALQHLREQASELKILGVYPAGTKPS
jgi:prephenate dehydratase